MSARASGCIYILSTPAPGAQFRGTLPKTPDAETFIKSKNWRWMSRRGAYCKEVLAEPLDPAC